MYSLLLDVLWRHLPLPFLGNLKLDRPVLLLQLRRIFHTCSRRQFLCRHLFLDFRLCSNCQHPAITLTITTAEIITRRQQGYQWKRWFVFPLLLSEVVVPQTFATLAYLHFLCADILAAFALYGQWTDLERVNHQFPTVQYHLVAQLLTDRQLVSL